MSKPARIVVRIFLALAATLLLVTCMGMWFPGLDVLGYLLFGWIGFLDRVVPQVIVRHDVLWSTLVYVLLLTVAAQWFLNWLCRNVSGAPTSNNRARRWRWSWTISALALVLITFSAGIAAVGVVHQTAWLVTSPQPIYRPGSSRARRVRCSSNLREIGMAMLMYAEAHKGKLPDTFGVLVQDPQADATPEIFVCPDTDDEMAEGKTPAEIAKALSDPQHCSYLYFGRGLTNHESADRVIAIDRPDNHHGDGINVLYADGHVDWLDMDKADGLLMKLGFERIEKTYR